MSKLELGIVIVFMTASFGLGYMCRSSMQGQTDTKDQTAVVKNNETVVTTVTHHDKNGDVKVTKTVDSVTKINKIEDKKVEDVPPVKSWNISVLGGYDLSKPRDLVPIYGVSINKQVLGPFTVGAYGMTNGILGISIGVTF